MAEPRQPADGNGVAIVTSIVVHLVLIVVFLRLWKPVAEPKENAPMTRYVELMRQQPQFTEAPGRKLKTAPLDAPLSDGNRRAATPDPSGQQRVARPGDGQGLFTPEMRSGRQPEPQQQPQQSPSAQTPAQAASSPFSQGGQSRQQPPKQPESRGVAAAAAPVDWRSAIRQASSNLPAGSDALDAPGAGGGEKGSADAGPLSFESSWFDWGAYAQSMVSKLRVNWYANMPQIIRTGLKGVVTIRFTIHRDGSITDIETLQTSNVPPYDFAARKAIELSSPLNPLPKDFPNATERVTCMFYYNMDVPSRR